MTTDTSSGDATEATPDDFDPAAWLAGATGTHRSVTVYARGDVMAELDELERQARIARQVPDDDRTLGDPTPDTLLARREELYRQFTSSALTIRLEGRDEAHHRAIDKRLKKAGVASNDDEGEQTLAYLASAIVSPKGIDEAWLRAFRTKSESQYRSLVTAYVAACGAPPVVTLPFSGTGSAARKQGTSS